MASVLALRAWIFSLNNSPVKLPADWLTPATYTFSPDVMDRTHVRGITKLGFTHTAIEPPERANSTRNGIKREHLFLC